MRGKMIEGMVKEVYGPRYGSEEEIVSDPLKEYLTGVIISKGCRNIEREPDSEATEESGENSSTDGTRGDEGSVYTPVELNPKMRPQSFGISCSVRGEETPVLKICVTWGRYIQKQDRENTKWQRKPHCFTGRISLDREKKDVPIYEGDDGRILLHIRKIRHDDKSSNILVHLINELDVKDEKCYGKTLTESSIYQPSIRINFEGNTTTEPLRSHFYKPQRREEQYLHFLYRNNPVLARGYMCSAIWRDIDYISYFNSSTMWPDGNYFSECREFMEPEIRSEFVPMYPDSSPSFEWDENRYGRKPVLSSYRLSEMWTEDDIEDSLSPLLEGYKKWIEENEAADIDGDPEISRKLIDKQKETLARLREGIDVLKKDEDLRLSFCFSNRTIWLQHRWKTGETDFVWRPFQLAFILLNIESIYDRNSTHRNYTDLLWAPTGVGKTEAYLALMALAMALRRRRALRGHEENPTGGGTAVITRYTLRLLTIQQFRRTLRMITAAELLRISESKGYRGWRPDGCEITGNWIYGSMRFSAGMWVGGGVSPNHLRMPERGAIDALRGREKAEGEPAQVISCPVCDSWIAIPESGLPEGRRELHIVMKYEGEKNDVRGELRPVIDENDQIKDLNLTEKNMPSGFVTLTLVFDASRKLEAGEIDRLGEEIEKHTSLKIVPFRASRPGYFGYGREPGRKIDRPRDFEIFCTDPGCELNDGVSYREGVPLNFLETDTKKFPDGLETGDLPSPFSMKSRMPIPACTVDEQIYSRCPTVVVSTADKIARLAFEPRAASIVGNIDGYNINYGYHRGQLFPKYTTKVATEEDYNTGVNTFLPPELIVQDELHLMEGPLGSMFGLYENVVEGLIERLGGNPKYIASTATIKDADDQVRKLFARDVFQFPPYGLEIKDSFFFRIPDWSRGWNEGQSGRIYMGLYSPGMGPLTPNVRIWSRLLKTSYDFRDDGDAKYFWTPVGYYNAVRELGGGRGLYREDIIERLRQLSPENPRPIDQENVVELSGRINSTEVPLILEELERCSSRPVEKHPDAVFTTSMFGTGVDIPHLSLMVVNGQPKTTAQYIQATGRVGRKHGGLVVTFLRAGRPRDLSHYEMFPAYHQRKYMEVEPSSVSPLAEGCLARASGPAMVSFLRNMYSPAVRWYDQENGTVILEDGSERDIRLFSGIISSRNRGLLDTDSIENYISSQKDRWVSIARQIGKDGELVFVEYPFRRPEKNVVLGDPHHERDPNLKVVYKNAPQSLREIEETTGFEV